VSTAQYGAQLRSFSCLPDKGLPNAGVRAGAPHTNLAEQAADARAYNYAMDGLQRGIVMLGKLACPPSPLDLRYNDADELRRASRYLGTAQKVAGERLDRRAQVQIAKEIVGSFVLLASTDYTSDGLVTTQTVERHLDFGLTAVATGNQFGNTLGREAVGLFLHGATATAISNGGDAVRGRELVEQGLNQLDVHVSQVPTESPGWYTNTVQRFEDAGRLLEALPLPAEVPDVMDLANLPSPTFDSLT
jgi:hypothetical protein